MRTLEEWTYSLRDFVPASDGAVVATQKLPALGASVVYPLQFRIFRATTQRTDPVMVLVRYVLDDKRRTLRNNCSGINDSLQKTF